MTKDSDNYQLFDKITEFCSVQYSQPTFCTLWMLDKWPECISIFLYSPFYPSLDATIWMVKPIRAWYCSSRVSKLGQNSEIIIEFCSVQYSQPTCCTLWMLQPGWYSEMLIFELIWGLFKALAIAKIMKHNETDVNFCQNLDFFSVFSYLWPTWRGLYVKKPFWKVFHTNG